MPAVEKVLSRSRLAQAEVRELELGGREGGRLERVDVREEVAADAVRVDEVGDAALQLGRRDDRLANGLAVRDRRSGSTGHRRHHGRGGRHGSVAVGTGAAIAIAVAVAVGVRAVPVLRGSERAAG